MVEENTAAGKDVGVPVAAGDSDGDILIYTLGTTEATDGAFDIDRATGQIKTKAALDADVTATYTVTVTATDPGTKVTDSITVTITVDGVNEPPEIEGDVEPYVENGDGDVAEFMAEDPENTSATVTWDLSGADASLFGLSHQMVCSPSTPRPTTRSLGTQTRTTRTR